MFPEKKTPNMGWNEKMIGDSKEVLRARIHTLKHLRNWIDVLIQERNSDS